eukprot:GHVL01020106.1.p1 GENE.GHVL01020106.1~~GHVL01020106.1.p1  ORF type:complete len:521 (-),score=117.39 GHVL01020106.1:2805-4367(-)
MKEAVNSSDSQLWTNAAKVAIKSRRLDVAQRCLTRLEDPFTLHLLREAPENLEDDAKLAIIAISLGGDPMIEEAKRLYNGCGRNDLLANVLQNCGEWEESLKITKNLNRRVVNESYAKYLEAIGETDAAIDQYKLAEKQRGNITRLLVDHDPALRESVNSFNDSKLHRWYAHLCEARGGAEAIEHYRKGNDWKSIVRVLCREEGGGLVKAKSICDETKNIAACFQLAQYLEHSQLKNDSVKYYCLSGRVTHALRVADECGYTGDLMPFIESCSSSREVLNAAKFYAQKKDFGKTVILLHKCGYCEIAIELCFEHQLFDSLGKIVDSVGENCDPELISRCAMFFLKNEQWNKSVRLLTLAKEFEKATDVCLAHSDKIDLTEDLAEKLTPDKDSMPIKDRSNILLKLAAVARQQGHHQLSCKKFTQAGDKVKAMKALLLSNDSGKISFFANTARQAEIYCLAANHFQTLDWAADPKLANQIVGFYTKAKNWNQLFKFYQTCAQVMIKWRLMNFEIIPKVWRR